MIDFGLLMSLLLAVGVPTLTSRRWPLSGNDAPIAFLDVAVGPAFVGLAVGRLVTLAIDDPNSIGSIADMIIIRSGVEFWPGAAAGMATVLVSARRAGVPMGQRVAELAPLAMVSYAAYEGACVFRDGCFGPVAPVGLRPPGLSTTMIPVGWFMAAAVAVAAIGVRRLVVERRSTVTVVGAAVVAVGAVRSLGSVWLPHVGDGLTRQHVTSLGVSAAAAVVLGFAVVAHRRQHRGAASPACGCVES